MITKKQMYYFLAVKDILELFAEQELGSNCEIDIQNVINYISSFKFANDSWGLTSKEEIYQLVTDDILDGYPIWQLLDIPEWTKNMLERELRENIRKERERLENTYKCYTCVYFQEHEGELGIYTECKRPIDYKGRRFKLKRRDMDFKPKKSCKYYKDKRKEGTKDDYS